jgi:glutathione S-transferase
VGPNGGTPKLYVILGSHACRTGMLLLEHKGIDYRRVEIPTGLQPFVVRLLGFRGREHRAERLGTAAPRSLALADRLGTVPALKMGKQRVSTNRAIARFLDRIQPAPPLFPADPQRRGAVEEAERWGDEVFQMVARRLALCAVLHGPDAIHRRGRAGRLGPLLWRSDAMRLRGTRFVGRSAFAASRRSEEQLLAELPAKLDRIDAWIADGVLDGDQLNAADYMIVTSLALLTYCVRLRPEIEARRSRTLIDRVLPEPV